MITDFSYAKENGGKRRATTLVKTGGAGAKYAQKAREPYSVLAIRHLLCATIESAVQEVDRLRVAGVIIGNGTVLLPRQKTKTGFRVTCGVQAHELVAFFGEPLERLLEIIDSPMLHADRIRKRVGICAELKGQP